MIVARADGVYFAETGWALESDYNQLAHPYRTYKVAGANPVTLRALKQRKQVFPLDIASKWALNLEDAATLAAGGFRREIP